MRVLLTFDDRVRKDSTGVYFYYAFSKIADVVKVYNEELDYINPDKFDMCVKIDDGLEHHRFPAHFKNSVYYVIDTHIHPDWRLKLAEEAKFDYIFCSQKPGSELNWSCDKVSFLPLGCDPDYHYAPCGGNKLYDICFIGNVQPGWQRRRVERLDTLFKNIPNFYFGQKFFKDVTNTYAQSKLVFNSAHSNDINMRVFESMCSGSCLFTDKQNWQQLFVDDYHLVSYCNEKEMIEKAKYYISNDAAREEIAERGQREVLEKHTYLHRVKEIIKKVTQSREI